MKKEFCPAYVKTCQKCGGKNHFAVKCFSKKRVQVVNETESESEESTFEDICLVQSSKKLVKAEMRVDKKPVVLQLDSGASVNLLSHKKLQSLKQQLKIKPTTKTLVMWNNSEVQSLGECRVKMTDRKGRLTEPPWFRRNPEDGAGHHPQRPV